MLAMSVLDRGMNLFSRSWVYLLQHSVHLGLTKRLELRSQFSGALGILIPAPLNGCIDRFPLPRWGDGVMG